MSLAVLIPVLNRPDRVAAVAESLLQGTPEVPLRIVWLCSPSDTAEIEAVEAAGYEPRIVPWHAESADFQRKINLGFTEAEEDWSFVGADDLVFTAGWFEAAMAVYTETGACFIGINDLGPRSHQGLYATHFLVHRDYRECGTIDGSGALLSEYYDHCFCDDEACETARHRGTYAYAREAVIDHLHPTRGKGDWDATYRKGMRAYAQDRMLYMRRRHLWNQGIPA